MRFRPRKVLSDSKQLTSKPRKGCATSAEEGTIQIMIKLYPAKVGAPTLFNLNMYNGSNF